MRARRYLVLWAILLAMSVVPSQRPAAIAARAGHAQPASRESSINLRALLHNSWETAYRSPFGAVPAGTHVTLRLRTTTKGASSVTLYLHRSDQFGKPVGTSHQAMTRAGGKRYDLWTATVTPTAIGVYTYTFQVKQGKSIAWYGPTAGRDGGVGQASKGKKEPDFAYRITAYDPGFKAPSWVSSAVIYQIFPDRFYNGDTSNDIPFHSSIPVRDTGNGCPMGSYDTGGYCAYTHSSWNQLPEQPPHGEDFFGGDLQGIDDKLAYVKSLGINTLYINPIFLAPSNHKYDTSDYYTIDPHFGTLDTFHELMADAHADGIRIILDGVFNHTGEDSIYFNKYGHFPDVGAYQSRQSPYYSWYTFLNWPNSYASFPGAASLPQLNESDAVKGFIFSQQDSVAQHWLAQGADGWRLDAAQEKSHTWWQQFRAAVKLTHPDDILIAEDTAGPTDPTPFILGNEVDGIMNYNFRDAILSFFTQGRTGTGGTTALSFVNNLMAMVQDYPLPAILSSMNLVDSHDTERVLNDLGENKNELKLVAAVQMSWLGVPTIYYGDEAGVTGATDPDDRRTFPWDHQDADLEAYYRKLIAVRNANPALRDGGVFPLVTDSAHRVVAFLRQDSQQHVVIVLNDGTASRTVGLKLPGVSSGTNFTDALSGKAYTFSAGKLSIQVQAHGVAILVQAPTSN